MCTDDVRTPGVPNAIPDLAKVSGDQNEERRSTDESGDGPSGPGPDGRVAGDSDRVASGNAAGPGPGSAPVTIGWSKSLARQGTGTNRSARNLWQKAIQASAQIVEEEQAGQAGQASADGVDARPACAYSRDAAHETCISLGFGCRVLRRRIEHGRPRRRR